MSGAVGCQQYSSQPLTLDAVNQQLAVPEESTLRTSASKLNHPLLKSAPVHSETGVSPDDAAILAVLINPDLKVARDQRGAAAAALLQAGLLPNPVLTYSSDFVTGGVTAGTFNAYGATLSWDFQQLISHGAKEKAAALSAESVDLSVAWQEWQFAEAAKQAMFDLVALQQQLVLLDEIDARLDGNLKTVKRGVDAGVQSYIELAAAEAAARESRAGVLQCRRDVEHQWQQLNRAIGFPPGHRFAICQDVRLPTEFPPFETASLVSAMETRRIDLLALHRGYASQEEALRAAILDQFPKINLGFNGASDNTNVHSVGLVATIDLPIFDRNQGIIAAERATRQKLFDEYISRVFTGRADIATAIADLHALNEQIADAQAAVPNLQRLVDAYKHATESGFADLISYYTAWNNLTQKQLAVLRLEQQMADMKIALELASGQSFPDLSAFHPSTEPEKSN